MEETICIIVCKGAYVDTPGSDYLFQKKRVFRISESAVFRYGQQKEVALKALVNLVPFETHIHIGVMGEEMADLLKEIKYFKGAELSIQEVADLEAAAKLGSAFNEDDEDEEVFVDPDDEFVFVNTKSEYLGGPTFFRGKPEIFAEFDDAERSQFVTQDFGGLRVDCGRMLDLYCERFGDTPGGAYLIARTMKFDHDLVSLKDEAKQLTKKATGVFNRFMFDLWK